MSQDDERWILVSRKLPVESGRYLVISSDGYVDIFWFNHKSHLTDGWGGARFWRPLPEPPKGESNG